MALDYTKKTIRGYTYICQNDFAFLVVFFSLDCMWLYLAALGQPCLPLVELGGTFVLVSFSFTWLHLVAFGGTLLPLGPFEFPLLPITAFGCTWFYLVSLPWIHCVVLGCKGLTLVALGRILFHLGKNCVWRKTQNSYFLPYLQYINFIVFK